MKLLILSDSHGNLSLMRRAIAAEQPDHILHLGDCLRDAEALAAGPIPVTAVPGNCDWGAGGPEIRTVTLGGVRIYMTHGHLHGVKSTPLRLTLAAREAGAAVALFGHTHRACCEKLDGLWLLNPGSCSGFGPATCGVIALEKGQAVCYNKTISE